MKASIIVAIVAILTSPFAYGLPGGLANPKDGNDGCGAFCQAIKGGSGMGISSPTCSGLTGNYCADNCECSAIGIMKCKNSTGLTILGSSTKCTDDAVTKTCVQGLRNQWQCWCQNLFNTEWGPGSNAGENCGSLFAKE